MKDTIYLLTLFCSDVDFGRPIFQKFEEDDKEIIQRR